MIYFLWNNSVGYYCTFTIVLGEWEKLKKKITTLLTRMIYLCGKFIFDFCSLKFHLSSYSFATTLRSFSYSGIGHTIPFHLKTGQYLGIKASPFLATLCTVLMSYICSIIPCGVIRGLPKMIQCLSCNFTFCSLGIHS